MNEAWSSAQIYLYMNFNSPMTLLAAISESNNMNGIRKHLVRISRFEGTTKPDDVVEAGLELRPEKQACQESSSTTNSTTKAYTFEPRRTCVRL